MDNIYYYGFLFLSFFAGVLLTSMYFIRKIGDWRIRWIEMEHDLAKLENREPRNIDSI